MKKYIFMKFMVVSLGISSFVSSTTLPSQQNSQDLSLCNELVIALNDNESKKQTTGYIIHEHIKDGGKLDFIVKNTRWTANIPLISSVFHGDGKLQKSMNNEKVKYQRATSFVSKDICLIEVLEIDRSELHHYEDNIASIKVTAIEKAPVKGENMDKKKNSDINFHFQ